MPPQGTASPAIFAYKRETSRMQLERPPVVAPTKPAAAPTGQAAVNFTSVSSFAFDQEKGLVKCAQHAETACGSVAQHVAKQVTPLQCVQYGAIRYIMLQCSTPCCNTMRHAATRRNRVYVSLDDVGELPKESVLCDFSQNSFDLKVLGLKVLTAACAPVPHLSGVLAVVPPRAPLRRSSCTRRPRAVLL